MKAGLAQISSRLREIPSIPVLLGRETVSTQLARTGRPQVVQAARAAAGSLRESLRQGVVYPSRDAMLVEFDRQFERSLGRLRQLSLRRVINATGVIIHTNLGRAPLAEEAIEAITAIAGGYSNLEFDLGEGARGLRDSHCEGLWKELLSCEAAAVVNNNAAAVLLVLNTLADGREVVISRGELVEIGGSFRIPEIMVKAGARLVEVGTTNRTRLSDYERAITEQTALILRVHQSNFKMVGFTDRPLLEDLVTLAHRRGLPVFEDLGSGCLTDLQNEHIAGEPLIQQSIRTGVDLCAFSGDKLLGGPQAGIIAGRRALVETVRQNPWMRVVRPDKLSLAALEATLQLYRNDLESVRLPVLRMIALPEEEIRKRARAFVRRARKRSPDQLRFEIVPGFSTVGGGSAPDARLPTALISVGHSTRSVSDLEQALRGQDPPVVARIEKERLLIDLRTVKPAEEPALLNNLGRL